MRQRTQRTTPAISGFTIVELLVATAVTAVLIALMITMTSGILTAWNRTSGNLTANNQAKMVLDQVAQDLQAAMLRYDPANPNAAWLAVDILDPSATGLGHTVDNLRNLRGWITPNSPDNQTHSRIIKPTKTEDNRSYDLEATDIADCRYGIGGAWLRLFSNGTEGKNTVPSAVSYQIIRRHITDSPPGTPNPAEVRYMLYRSEVGSKSGNNPGPLRDGYDLTGIGGGPQHYANSGPLINPPNMDIIANNVIDFGIRLYVRMPGALDPVFPVNPATLSFNDSHTQYLADGAVLTNTPFPDVADIMVRILTEEGARQIQHLEAGRTFQNLSSTAEKHRQWWDIAEANSRVFTRRVFLNARAY